jgi:hypothetical protein
MRLAHSNRPDLRVRKQSIKEPTTTTIRRRSMLHLRGRHHPWALVMGGFAFAVIILSRRLASPRLGLALVSAMNSSCQCGRCQKQVTSKQLISFRSLAQYQDQLQKLSNPTLAHSPTVPWYRGEDWTTFDVFWVLQVSSFRFRFHLLSDQAIWRHEDSRAVRLNWRNRSGLQLRIDPLSRRQRTSIFGRF